MNIRKNLTLVVSGGVTLLAMIAALVIVFQYRGRYTDVRAQLDEKKMRRDSLILRHPFPDEENVQLTAVNVEQTRQSLLQLQERLVRGQYAPPDLGPDRFPGELSRMVQGLNRLARDNSVTVQATAAAYGFEKYAKGELPRREDVPVLMRQLEWVRSTCQALFNAKIVQLNGVERRVFETAAPAAAGATMPGLPGIERRPVDSSGDQGNATLLNTFFADPDKLFERERMIYTFTATESSLRDVLNSLARLPAFCAVMSLTVDNLTPKPQRVSLTKPGEAGAPVEGGAVPGLPPAGGGYALPPLGGDRPPVAPAIAGLPSGDTLGTSAQTGPRTRQQRVVAGRSEFLKITLAIDYYQFAAPVKESQP